MRTIEEGFCFKRHGGQNDMRKPVGEKICRCNTCRNNDDELSGECYECIKGIFDHYEPQESEDIDGK